MTETESTPAVRVRRAGPLDAEALHRVAAATFALACPPGTRRSDIAAFIAGTLSRGSFERYLADPDRALLLAESGGHAVGYCMLVLADPGDPDVARAVTVRPTAELSKCYVRREHHGSGVAAALIEGSVGIARDAGARSVWLGVNQHNHRADRFYEKHGFVTVGAKRFLVGEQWHDDFVKERALRP